MAGVVVETHAESLVFNGIYQGKDIYVKNPFSSDGVGFCAYEVYVNGSLTRDEINSSAFAIDFNILGIKTGSPIEVVIRHKSGCAPIILNPEAIKPHSTYVVKEIGLKNNIISWQTEGESGSLPYIVEQFRWNKWVKAGEVEGEGTVGVHSYQFKLDPYSGENRVRIKQVDYTGKPRYSKELTYDPGLAPVSFEPKKVDAEIVFSRETRYEIFDKFGNVVETGFGKTVNVSNLPSREDYYLNYDSKFGETFRKK
jgi:hypothetical protein